MKYALPKSEKSEGAKLPVTANFAPPPVEQPTSLAPSKDADEEDDENEAPARQPGNPKA